MVTPYQMGPIQTCSPGTLSLRHMNPFNQKCSFETLSLTSIGKQSVGLHMKCLLVKNGLQMFVFVSRERIESICQLSDIYLTA